MTINQIIKKHKIKEVTSNLQDGDHETAVFYFLKEGTEEIFNSRLEDSRPCFLFLNRDIGDIGVPYHVCVDFYEDQTDVCNILYPNSNKVKTLAITGTNGKSTCVHLCSLLLNYNGCRAFSVGTLGVYSAGNEIFPSPGATTPSYLDLRRITHHLSDYEYMCLEVSSHALKQQRVRGLNIDVAGWTNLSQDHLDYHGTMKDYFESKLMLAKLSKKLFVPSSQAQLISKIEDEGFSVEKSRVRDFSLSNPAFQLRYNNENLCLSYDLVCSLLNKELKVPGELSLPKGRYTLFENDDDLFVVDYAHTPDAIEKLTRETRDVLPNHYIITIFGCGGDRDKSKRPLMLDAALKYSDKVIVTSDNPRSEDPLSIIEDALNNRDFKNVMTISSREDAIKSSVKKYEDKTIVLIAGKGHEEYQEVNGIKKYFSDIELVKESLEHIK